MRKAIFWDRDGIINQITIKGGKSMSPRKFSDFKVFPFINDLLSEINKLGYLNLIFTNQHDISRGLMEAEELNLMHNLLLNNYPISKIYFCPHSNEDNCSCRKPKIALFEKANKKYNIDKTKSYMIGDRYSDIRAGIDFNLKTIKFGDELNLIMFILVVIKLNFLLSLMINSNLI